MALLLLQQLRQQLLRGAMVANPPPCQVQKRFMGGVRKTLARAKKLRILRNRKARRREAMAKRPVDKALESTLAIPSRRETMMWRLKRVLAASEGRVLPASEAAKVAPPSRGRRCPTGRPVPDFVKRCRTVFRHSRDEEDRSLVWVEFTKEAEELVEKEEEVLNEYQRPKAVELLRKLLMMSRDHRLPLMKLEQVKPTFCIPDDFEASIIPAFPQFFEARGDELVLTGYDQGLAVTAREVWLRQQFSRKKDMYCFNIPADRRITRQVASRLAAFQKLPFPSPYDGAAVDNELLHDLSLPAQKRAVAVCHELLSLSVQKKVPLLHIQVLGKELRLPPKVEDMLLRYPHIFYVSSRDLPRASPRDLSRAPRVSWRKKNSGNEPVVFLREAYHGSTLKDPHPLHRLRSKLVELLHSRPCSQPLAPPSSLWLPPSSCSDSASSLQATEREQEDNDDAPSHVDDDAPSYVDDDVPSCRWKPVRYQHFAYRRYQGSEEHDDGSPSRSLGEKLGIFKEAAQDADEERRRFARMKATRLQQQQHANEESDEEFVPKRHKRFKNAWKNKIEEDKIMERKRARRLGFKELSRL